MAKKKRIDKTKRIFHKRDYPTLELKTPREIAADFAEKVVKKFSTLVKSIILFGSTAKSKTTPGSDIDIIIIVDDATIRFDDKFIMWYREELGKLVQVNPYKKDLHINTIKLTTFWEDLIVGDPTVINVVRYGEVLIDVGGFFNPLKILLQDGRIRPTPESIYNVLNRVPGHIMRSRLSEISSVEGCYWAFVESAQSILMAIKILPPSPEFIPELLKQNFVDKKLLDKKFIYDFENIFELHRKAVHGEIKNIDGRIVDDFQEKAEGFFKACVKILNQILG